MVRFEMIFLIFAGALLATLMLTENSGNMSTEETVLTSKIGLNAISVANSFIEKVTSSALYFDEYTVTHAVQPRPTSPTDSAALLANLSATLGPEPGESSPTMFEDVDDYNNYSDTVGVEGVGIFHVVCKVRYYDPSGDTTTSTRTWYKLITVAVTDTVPGSDVHFLQIQGEQVAIRRSVVVSYYNFL
jgi:hypothetical protein